MKSPGHKCTKRVRLGKDKRNNGSQMIAEGPFPQNGRFELLHQFGRKHGAPRVQAACQDLSACLK